MGDLVGIEKFAEVCGCSVRYAQRLVREGKCPKYYPVGRKVRFHMADIEAWLEAKAVDPGKEKARCCNT